MAEYFVDLADRITDRYGIDQAVVTTVLEFLDMWPAEMPALLAARYNDAFRGGVSAGIEYAEKSYKWTGAPND